MRPSIDERRTHRFRTEGGAVRGRRRYGQCMKFDDLLDGVGDDADDVHEELAQGVADELRDAGLSSANSVDLPLDAATEALPFPVDVERIRRRVNDILAARWQARRGDARPRAVPGGNSQVAGASWRIGPAQPVGGPMLTSPGFPPHMCSHRRLPRPQCSRRRGDSPYEHTASPLVETGPRPRRASLTGGGRWVSA